jgi:quercetin dioxygenase-like cupin family protein
MPLERWNEAEDGPLTELALREKLERRGYRVSRYVYPPGTFFPDHSHGVDKIDAVFSGRFRITLVGEEAVLEPGDCIAVPRGLVHSAEVIGEDAVISFDAVRS